MAATTSSQSKHYPKKKPTTTISFRRRRIKKETTISTTAVPATTNHRNPSAVSPENTSWCCPPGVSSYKPPTPLPISCSPAPESFSIEKHRLSNSESNLEKPQLIPTTTMSPTTVYGGAGNYQENLVPSSFTQFNTALTAGLLNPVSSPPPTIDKTRSSPTLFEMMANEPDSKIQNNGAITALKRPSNVGYVIPPMIVVDKQSLLQQRLSEMLSCRSPGNRFNDPNSSDVKLTLSSKDGFSVCLNVHRQILVVHSRFFADKLSNYRKQSGQQGPQLRGLIDNMNPYIVEIADCDDIEVYIESIRLMYCRDLRRKLMKDDVSRVLGILKVSAAIGFDAGVLSCLEYLEAVPWAEDEEEKVASLLSDLQLDNVAAGEVLKRISFDVNSNSNDDNIQENQDILLKLLNVVLEGTDEKARRDMKILVSKLLHENSSKNDLKKESLYSACEKCLSLLQDCFLKASKGDFQDVAQIIRQSGNLHWLLDILIDRQISEDFLKLWASQTELSEAHSKVPAIHRYEISRVTSRLFVGIGKSQLLASKESKCLLLQTWLEPFYDDFNWMRRGSRGLDRNLIEEGLSNTILTLPLTWQQDIFMSWFDRFLNSGDDCPNIQKGFEIWWKRAFWRKPETQRQIHITNANGRNS
ncbi:BTB/POZ domain-containing protein At1g63850-like [Rutidosis leptorrhynchoides]|uniref:BTB/POZ domain-containing protein At1g63850-like n=1 Tax=Rutidosis leptorrhynchoides TaxID=125765 RepID=UPI003A98F9B7